MESMRKKKAEEPPKRRRFIEDDDDSDSKKDEIEPVKRRKKGKKDGSEDGKSSESKGVAGFPPPLPKKFSLKKYNDLILLSQRLLMRLNKGEVSIELYKTMVYGINSIAAIMDKRKLDQANEIFERLQKEK